jgi:hypothetical protein
MSPTCSSSSTLPFQPYWELQKQHPLHRLALPGTWHNNTQAAKFISLPSQIAQPCPNPYPLRLPRPNPSSLPREHTCLTRAEGRHNTRARSTLVSSRVCQQHKIPALLRRPGEPGVCTMQHSLQPTATPPGQGQSGTAHVLEIQQVRHGPGQLLMTANLGT